MSFFVVLRRFLLHFLQSCDKIKNMSKKEIISFCFMSIFAGMAIGFGAVSSLLANSLLPGLWGRLVGGSLFSLGIFAVVCYEMNLFTGMVAGIPTMGVKNLWKLPVCFLGNALGIGLIALLARFTVLGDTIAAQAATLIGGKLESELWYVNVFCSAVLCGLLITFSVRSVKYAPAKGLSATLGVILPIVVFAFCGFDHSVANMLYFYYLGEISWQIVGYILISILGNLVGGILLPLVDLFKEKQNEEAENASSSEEK